MPLDQSGVKWSCEPCVRGHRSSKCEHYERIMVRVKKPGRPLSSCPHPPGSCSCRHEKMLMVKIQTNSGCVCEPRFYVTPEGNRIPVDSNGRTVTLPGADSPPKDAAIVASAGPKESKRAFKEESGDVPGEQLLRWQVNGSSHSPTHFDTTTREINANGNASRLESVQPGEQRSIQSSYSQVSSARGDRNSPPKKQKLHSQQDSYGLSTEDILDAESNSHSNAAAPSYGGHHQNATLGSSVQNQALWSGLPVDDYASFAPSALYNPQWMTSKHAPDPLFGTDFHGTDNISVPNGALHNGSQCHDIVPSGMHGHSLSHGECACGEGCTCFACTTHPFNEATTSRFKEIQQILDTDLADDYSSVMSNFDFSPGVSHTPQPLYTEADPTLQPVSQGTVGSFAANGDGSSSISMLPYQNFLYHFEVPRPAPNAPQEQKNGVASGNCCSCSASHGQEEEQHL